MRESYQDSPGQARDASVRRLGRLTWRATQLGALATAGFAVVFARNAPAQAGHVQDPATVTPTPSATMASDGAPRQQVTSPASAETGGSSDDGTSRTAGHAHG